MGLDMRDMRISPYLQDSRFSKSERELLFKLRSKTIWVKDNFRNAYLDNDMLCYLCKLFPCTQSHPLQCPQLTTTMIVDKKLNINDKFIYGDVEQQGGDVNWTEWSKVNTESLDSGTSRTSYWHTLCCSLILLCAIIFLWIVINNKCSLWCVCNVYAAVYHWISIWRPKISILKMHLG